MKCRASQKDEHLKCMALTELRSTRSQEIEEEEETIEEFLNFHFVGYETTGVWKPSINGYQNILPSIPYMVSKTSQSYDLNVGINMRIYIYTYTLLIINNMVHITEHFLCVIVPLQILCLKEL